MYEANFIGAKFLKEANFSRAKFSYEPYWGKTEFKDQRNFRGIKIDGIKEFSEEEFVKKLKKSQGFFKKRKFNFEIKPELFEDIFENKTINIGLDFSNVVFLKKADFTGLKFKEKVNFYKTIFKDTAIFSVATFGEENKQEKDTEVIRKNESDKQIENPEDIRKNELDRYIPEIFRKLAGVSFEQATFKGKARFNEAKFLSKANLYKTEFLDTAIFSEAKFEYETHFGHAKFESIVHFSKAQLLEDTDFTFAVFKGLTSFRQTKFKNKLSFYKTKFADHVNFNDSQFQNCYKEEAAAVFGKTEFSKELDFENIIIEGNKPLKFNSVIFSRQYLTDFCEINEEKKTEEIYAEKHAPLIFEDILFPSEFVFSRCNLSKTEFLDCIIENARFLNCQFSTKGHFPFNRDSFYFKEKEEKETNKKNIWGKIETYLKLLKSYLKFSLVWLVIVQILLLFFPKIIEMWLSPYTIIIITIVGIFFSLIHLLRLEKRIVKSNSLLVVFGALFSAGILLSYFPDIHFGNITTGLPFFISFVIIVVLFCWGFFYRLWVKELKTKRKNQVVKIENN